MTRFSELGLNEDLLTSISYLGFEEATPIQEKAIPLIMEGNDIIACAQTGTGKTGAFLLPIINRLMSEQRDGISTLIVVPTRELAIQIDQQVEGMSYGTGISSIAIYGGGKGVDWQQEKEVLKHGSDIVVATPGKLISHLNLGYVDFSHVKYLILDEADRMLDIGFHEDMMKIISFLPKDRQSLMFSATMPPKIKTFANKILKNPKEISISISKPAEGIMQIAYLTYDHQKLALIQSLISGKKELSSIIIFSSTKKQVGEIVRALKRKDINAHGISSDLEQSDREKVIRKFRAQKIRVLVATDVISRGIDIANINLVINYNVPKDAEDYVHRIGRTARADSTGVAITFINEDDRFSFHKIEKLIEKEIMKLHPPADIGKGPDWKVVKGRGRGRGNQRTFHKKKRKGGYRKNSNRKK